jgi:hypothetical protein
VTPSAAWHPADAVLQEYVDGGLPGLSASSVEAHLLTCATCRHGVREAVPTQRLARLRETIDDRLDQAQRPRLERLLVRLGVTEVDARALLAAPNLRLAFWLAVAGAVLLGLLVANDTRHPDAVFLLLAPLLPLAATAVAYAPALDPAYELCAVTPARTARLLLARSLAVCTASLVGLTALGLALPSEQVTAVVWLLPAAALTLVVLLLAPRLEILPAAALVGGSWLVLVASLAHQGVDISWMQDVAVQIVAAAILFVALGLLMHRSERLDVGGRT